jgi:hypothetical protein
MPDWKRVVREKLGTLPFTDGRRDEVIEELAQQLESAYEEALAQGINEQEALRRSLAQFKDWEKLRNEVFQSVEGTRLPVWEQNSIFAPRRWPVWITLAMTLFLLAVPAFRQALAILPIPGSDPTTWTSRAFSEKALRRIEQSGDKRKYARALAFVALHSAKEDDLRAMHAAEQAIALDPQLTWISAKVSHATYSVPGYDPHPWIEGLKAWDPQNGLPYLLEASANVHWWEPPWSKYSAATTGLRDALAAEPRWRGPMEKAFAAPRLDFYETQRFALDRQVLQEQGFDRPDILILNMWSQPLPDFLAIQFYEDIELKEVGDRAEKAGHTEAALAAYWNIAHFGERIEDTCSELLQGYSWKFREDAYKRILSLSRREGRTLESAAVESALAALLNADPRKVRRLSFSSATNAGRSARIVQLSGLFAILLAVATLMWLVSLVALKWRADVSRTLNRIASVLCFAPPLLLLSCLALFLEFYPYARSIGQYASMQELQEVFGPLFMHVYDFMDLGSFREPWLTTMFWPSIWCAVVALFGGGLLWRARRRTRPDPPTQRSAARVSEEKPLPS